MATADEYAAWIVQNADKKGSPEFETVAKAYELAKQEKPKAERGPVQEAAAAAGALGSGFNRSMLSRLGLPFNPVDAAANVLDLGKAALGAPYIAATGKSPPDWLAVGDRADVPGSGAWLVNQARKTRAGRAVLDASPDYEGGYLQTIGGGLGASPSAPVSAMTSAALQKATYDATGSDALAMAAGMSPTMAKAGLREVGRNLMTPRDPRAAALAERAIDKGIPLNIADITDSRMVKAARSVMNDTPGLAALGAKQDQGKQPAFNRAIGGTFGANADELTPNVMATAKRDLGSKFDRIWGSNSLAVDAPMFQSLQRLRAGAAELPQGDRQRLVKWIDDIWSQTVQGPNGQPIIPGDVANKYQSRLRQVIESAPEGFIKNDLQTLRQTMLDAFNRNISGPDAQALSEVRGQYKAFKTVEPLLKKAEAGVAGRMTGDVPAALLPNAVAQSYDSPAGTPLGELSQIGSRFLVNRVPQTGGSNRAMIQNTALGGGALAALGVASPVAAGVGAGLSAMAQLAIGSPSLAKQLLKNGNITKAEAQILANIHGQEDK